MVFASCKIVLDFQRRYLKIIHLLFLSNRDMFGEECVSNTDESTITVTVDGKSAILSLETRVGGLQHVLTNNSSLGYCNV